MSMARIHHREGGFGDYVVELALAIKGDIVRVSREENSELFYATIGGMGLTGVILEAMIRLRPVETGWIRETTIVAKDLNSTIAALDVSDDATYSVAWIDCLAKGSHLGRSLVYLGEHAASGDLDGARQDRRFPEVGEPRLSVPIGFPGFALNRCSVSVFNEAYFRMGARKAGQSLLIAASPYFFPLDGVGDWNRIYGSSGFIQHQCVIPLGAALPVIAELLDRISRRGDASFLAVLKKLGRSSGMLSFPIDGYTLAVDIPLTSGLLKFLEDLDCLVTGAGGRIYLAKDARQSRETFGAGYPNADKFRAIRRDLGIADRVRLAPFAETGPMSKITSTMEKTVLVLGGGSDIGRSAALVFAENGWSIGLAGRSIDELRREANDIATRTGASVTVHNFDALDTGRFEIVRGQSA